MMAIEGISEAAHVAIAVNVDRIIIVEVAMMIDMRLPVIRSILMTEILRATLTTKDIVPTMPLVVLIIHNMMIGMTTALVTTAVDGIEIKH